MDAQVKEAVIAKIDESISNADEVQKIQSRLGIAAGSDFAFGVAVGRIYNSFYYQSRRILGRNPSDAEFLEFLSLLSERSSELRRTFLK